MSSTGTVSNFPPPMFGLGLWKIPKESCAEVVYLAIRMGVRHLDCACDYGNELEVGTGITGKLSFRDTAVVSMYLGTFLTTNSASIIRNNEGYHRRIS